MKGGPALEARGADFARPATEISERLLRGFFMRPIGSMHDHATIGEKDRCAGGGGDRDRKTTGTATLQYRMMAAREEALPRKREAVGAETREVRQMRPARTGGNPVGSRDFGADERDLTHRRSSACSRRKLGPRGFRRPVRP